MLLLVEDFLRSAVSILDDDEALLVLLSCSTCQCEVCYRNRWLLSFCYFLFDTCLDVFFLVLVVLL